MSEESSFEILTYVWYAIGWIAAFLKCIFYIGLFGIVFTIGFFIVFLYEISAYLYLKITKNTV